MNEYLIKADGDWNISSITSKTLGNSYGYAPIYRGGCIGIIPYEDKYIWFREDDDHYWEESILTKEQLTTIRDSMLRIVQECTKVIDYAKAESYCFYREDKNSFYNRDYTKGEGASVQMGDRFMITRFNSHESKADFYHANSRITIITLILNK